MLEYENQPLIFALILDIHKPYFSADPQILQAYSKLRFRMFRAKKSAYCLLIKIQVFCEPKIIKNLQI